MEAEVAQGLDVWAVHHSQWHPKGQLCDGWWALGGVQQYCSTYLLFRKWRRGNRLHCCTIGSRTQLEVGQRRQELVPVLWKKICISIFLLIYSSLQSATPTGNVLTCTPKMHWADRLPGTHHTPVIQNTHTSVSQQIAAIKTDGYTGFRQINHKSIAFATWFRDRSTGMT